MSERSERTINTAWSRHEVAAAHRRTRRMR